LSITDRIYRFAEGLLALKEQEYLGQPQTGPITSRVQGLASTILHGLEAKHSVKKTTDQIPERAKEIRRAVIAALESNSQTPEQRVELESALEDVFFVIQLYSYPGDYVAEKPVPERIAETLDKFEEDVLHATYPEVRGDRRVVVAFGDPVTIPGGKDGPKPSVAEWTDRFEKQVQSLLDEINSTESPDAASSNSTNHVLR
jgi:hypothetical protein